MEIMEFVDDLCLRIQAGIPILWVEACDETWLVKTLQQRLCTIKCESIETLEKEKLETFNGLLIWQDITQDEMNRAAKALLKHVKRASSSAVLLILASSSLLRPNGLEQIPIIMQPLPDIVQRRLLIEQTVGDFVRDESTVQTMSVVSAGLSRLQIERILSLCRIRASKNADNAQWGRHIVEEKKALLAANLSIGVIDDSATLADVGGADDLKAWLEQRTRAFGDEASAFGLESPRGVMIVGIQGCGKSLIAKAIANAWQFPLIQLDMSAIFASSQSPDAVLRNALAVADAISPAVIWCDEIEKAFAQGADPITRRLLGAILSWLQERRSSAFFVATANDITALPAELMRKGRFDEVFFIDLPDEQARKDIFSIHLKKRRRLPENFDLNILAMHTANFSGAEIEQAVISALFSAFARNCDISTDILLDAIHDIIPLFKQREEEIKRLREWAGERTRNAASRDRVLSFFS